MFDEELRKRERSASGRHSVVSLVQLSTRLARSGQLDDAVELAIKALESAPTSRVVRDWLAQLGLARGPWPSRFGDSDQACRSPLRGAREGRIAWRLPIPGSPRGTPVLSPDGQAMVTTDAERLVFVGRDGALAEDDAPWDATVSPTIGDDGRVLAVCRERGPLRSNFLLAFPDTRRPDTETLEPALVDARRGLTYASWDGFLRSCEGVESRPLLKVSTHPHSWARPSAAFLSDGRGLFGSVRPYAGELVCLDPDGHELWRLEARSAIAGPTGAAVSEAGIVARIGDQVYGLDDDGQVRWRQKTHVADWWRPVTGEALPQPALFGDIAVLATSWGLLAVSTRTGKEIFQRAKLKTPRAPAIDVDGVIHVSVPGRLVGLDLEGRTVYETKLPGRGRAASAPAIGCGGVTLVIALDELIAVA